jgi:hypothetical protein
MGGGRVVEERLVSGSDGSFKNIEIVIFKA